MFSCSKSFAANHSSHHIAMFDATAPTPKSMPIWLVLVFLMLKARPEHTPAVNDTTLCVIAFLRCAPAVLSFPLANDAMLIKHINAIALVLYCGSAISVLRLGFFFG